MKNGFSVASFHEQADMLSVSVAEMEEKYGRFIDAIEKQGWSARKIVLKIPATASFLVDMEIDE